LRPIVVVVIVIILAVLFLPNIQAMIARRSGLKEEALAPSEE
jgi:type II secretory pathway pseudopilin PulG